MAAINGVHGNGITHEVGNKLDAPLMGKHPLYAMPPTMRAIPREELDVRSDEQIDKTILNAPPVSSEKNVWFFWDKGYSHVHQYAKRNIRAWHRRLSPFGWTIRVVDLTDGPSGISKFLDTTDPKLFPACYHEGRVDGPHRGQTVSDLVRCPLLLTYGGIYSDVTTMILGDLEKLCNSTIFDPASRYEFIVFNGGNEEAPRCPFNFFMAARPGNPYIQRVQDLLMILWASEGGRTNIGGMDKHPLIKDPPRWQVVEEMLKGDSDGRSFAEWRDDLWDYGVHMTVMNQVLGTVDKDLGWNGPEYGEKHIFALDIATHALLIDYLAFFSGARAFQLLSLPLPREGTGQTEDQKAARNIVEQLLATSFAVKLGHSGTRIFGETLGLLWRKNAGSDDVVGTYAHWLRFAMVHWTRIENPKPLEFKAQKPLKVGPLLRVE
ncbi:MAG: hypothetical protein M1820_008726 [Bogoriella megaspora]|nr:MAG: hypothetical protein M1820_008726 [Bogoriella megaspora]